MRRPLGSLGVALFLLAVCAAEARAKPNPRKSDTDQIIIKFRNRQMSTASVLGPAHVKNLSSAAGVEVRHLRRMSGEAQVLKLPSRMPIEQVEAIVKRLSADPDVEYVEPDWILWRMLEPTADPRYNDQWHLKPPTVGSYGANLPGAWDITTGASDIVVAVLDSGIVPHADFAGRIVQGYDFVRDPACDLDGPYQVGIDTDPSDPGPPTQGLYGFYWHGTLSAGIIGAVVNNSTGIAGINWVSKIQPVRVIGGGDCGVYESDDIDGMRWAAGLPVDGAPTNPYPAKVLNISLGGTAPCALTLQTAVNEITAKGAVIITAAGNENQPAGYVAPGNCKGVIDVAATDKAGNKADYSNSGATVAVSAPGGELAYFNDPNGILTTNNYSKVSTPTPTTPGDTYDTAEGTSESAPVVAGVASLMLSVKPTLTPAQVRNILMATATPFPDTSDCNVTTCGAGIVNAAAAVAMAASVQPLHADDIAPSLSRFYLKGCDGNYAETTVSSTGTPDFIITAIDTGTAATGLRIGSGTHVGGTAAMSSTVLLLHFDAGAVNIDSTVYHNPVAIGNHVGSVDHDPTAAFGKALNWTTDGSNDQVTVFASDDLNSVKHQLTFQAWVRPTDVSAERIIFQWADSSGAGPTLRLRTDGSLYANLKSTDNASHEFWTSSNALPTGKWSLVTLTHGSVSSLKYGKIYASTSADTAAVLIASASYQTNAPLKTSGNLYLGRNGITGASWRGDMDEVRLLNRAMPDEAEAVAGDYYAGQFHYTVMGSTGPFIVRHITG
ncbi:MAG: S8 family serine peptidase, partial [Elusimicrobia bacterium]|nr:S8 family serine peptidase [Elusimicrobiota bacterium]